MMRRDEPDSIGWLLVGLDRTGPDQLLLEAEVIMPYAECLTFIKIRFDVGSQRAANEKWIKIKAASSNNDWLPAAPGCYRLPLDGPWAPPRKNGSGAGVGPAPGGAGQDWR